MARSSVKFLPSFYRTDKNTKFLSSTLDQLISQPELERLNGYIGSRLTPNYNPSKDQYIVDPDQPTKYQLQPGLVIEDKSGNIKNTYSFDDLINQLAYHGADVKNLDRLFRPDYFAYDPQIDWDKLINFREYYWLPTGPDPISISGTQRELVSTYTVTDSADGKFFIFSPDGVTESPLLTLYRGTTYVFNIESKHKFYFRHEPGYGLQGLEGVDIVNNGATKGGQIIINVNNTTPALLYYAAETDQVGGGQVSVKNVIENSFINVDEEIVGKKTYISGNGVTFVNGLKINFVGDVQPATYQSKTYIVEGVGSAISLVDYDLLDTPEMFATQYNANFDAEEFDDFPFDNFKNVPIDPSYITINRASRDLNPWTRYNRWFHSSVLEAVASASGNALVLPVEKKAKRPIVEFKPNLQLFNFGKSAIVNVDLIDNDTLDVFSLVEGSSGYWVDGVKLEQGYRVIFNADPDVLVKGRVYEVRFELINGSRKLNLTATEDHIPATDACVTVEKGEQYQGTVWWFNGSAWVFGQQKTTINQAPMFDVFDPTGYSYGSSHYTSNFKGTRVFGYADGTVYDSVLGLNLKYQSSGLESSYLFANFFNTDNIVRVYPDLSETDPVNWGLLKHNITEDSFEYCGIWTDAEAYSIPVVQFQVATIDVTRLPITVFDNPGYISDISVDVFVNNVRYNASQYSLVRENENLFVEFSSTVSASADGTKIIFNIHTSASPNSSGTYSPPLNLTNNPLNGPAAEMTLSELYDHVNTMIDRHPDFSGSFPGASNLGVLPDAAKYATRIIFNNNPLAIAQQFISNKENNLFEAIKAASDDYNQFKLNLIKLAGQIEPNDTTPNLLDQIIISLNENKNTLFPYFLSDMLPYGTNKKTRTYTVTDSRNTEYAITEVFDSTAVSNKAVIVYLNSKQLLIDKDYKFDDYESTIVFNILLNKGDVIVIEEFHDTDGSYIAPTPTKLGLYPKFEPKIYQDDSYADGPKNVIQGHDGSLLIAFNDYRDDIILEFETRVYNNLKTAYNPELLDINSILPGIFRSQQYEYSEVYKFVVDLFKKWTLFYSIDYESNLTYDISNHKTWNYKSATDSMFGKTLPGSWRSVYKYYFDTDRPHTHPWEMLGITVKPDWWDSYYGTAPYTAGNLKLWNDLEQGLVAQGTSAGINPLYARPGLLNIIPVDDSGTPVDPREWAAIGDNDSIQDTDQDWAFGDWGPAENAWRRSSNWPFAVQIILALAKPADYASKLFDTSRVVKNNANQYQYKGNPLSAYDYNAFSDTVNGEIVRAAGYSVYVIEAGKKRNTGYLELLKTQIRYSDVRLISKLKGFVNKDKLNIIVDSAQLDTKNPSPYLPAEDYSIHFNVSNPIKTIAISGVIVIKSNGKFIVRGYDKKDLFFNVYQPIHQKTDPAIRIGGTTEEFLTWTAGKSYQASQIVYYQSNYYRVVTNHIASSTFNASYYTMIPAPPAVGGVSIQEALRYENEVTVVDYGSKFTTIQEVADFLYGYGKWLETQGFIFDEYNADFVQTVNWAFTVKEFVYWTTQNWADNSVITLSPFANQVKFTSSNGVVDNILDNFYEYSLLKADGLSFPANNFSLVRADSSLTIKTQNTFEGIFFARLNVVQKEHVLVFNNTTVFGDIIYEPDSGYRQQRIKLEGFRTANWNGDFVSPGFVYDNAVITDWTPYADYGRADVVRYVGKYYSALDKISGTSTFDFAKWQVLDSAPMSQLLPNFDYKINQFEDFYSLDIDNFDKSQQKMAQHLTGYSPRSYLNNIFDNSISQYKFYQGYIKEKGTLNAINKLEKASAASLQGKLETYEEWAFRTGYFGSYSSYNELEFPLRERDFIENSQLIEFVSELPVVRDELTSYILPTDIAISPTDYVPSSTFSTVEGTYNANNLILPHAGYPRLDDVQYTVLNYDILSTSTNAYVDGDKVWMGFDYKFEWDVYRYTRQLSYITNATLSGSGTVTFTTNKAHGLKAGDVVAINNLDTSLNGVYIVTAISSLTSFSVASDVTYVATDLPKGTLSKFEPARFDSVDDVSNLTYLADIHEGELFWIDDIGDGRWGVLKKVDNYNSTEIFSPKVDLADQSFADKIVKQANSSTMVVSADNYYDDVGGRGRLYVFDNSAGYFTNVTNFALNQVADQYRPTTDKAQFGDNIFFDETDGLIFAAASNASHVRIDSSGTVRQVRATNTQSSYTNLGLVKISGFYKSYPQAEIPHVVISDPNPQSNSRFGSGIHVQRQQGTKRVLIGAPGQATSGTVYRFNVDVESTDVSPITFATPSSYLTTGTGINASFNVTVVGSEYSVEIVNTGTGYIVGSAIRIDGDQIGGIKPRNNLNIVVLEVNSLGSIITYKAKYLDAPLVTFTINAAAQTQLDRPPVIADYGLEPQPDEFGYSISGDADATRLAVSSPGFQSGKGGVHIYELQGDSYIWSQSIPNYHDVNDNPEYAGRLTYGDRLGAEVKVSEDGKYLFISSHLAIDSSTGPGKVWAYEWNGNKYEFLQLLNNPSREHDLNFGHAISINTEGTVLTITSQGTNLFNGITFDGGNTTFDGDSCKIGDVTKNSGSAYVYNRYNKKFLLAQELFDNSVDENSHYGKSVVVNDGTIYVGSPGSINSNTVVSGSVYLWNAINPNIKSWELYREQTPLIDVSLVERAFSIDVLKESVLEYLDVIDPLKGRIPGIADRELKYKAPSDPAVYNQAEPSSPVVLDYNSYWGPEHVGELWWDLSTVKYVWYEQGEASYRKTTWGQLFPGATIDVYEWVASSMKPSQWASIADTNSGLAAGISGTPKFADDTVYSSSQVFDKGTEQFTTVYYFWVKNKTTVPVNVDRLVPSTDVASLLTSPKAYGLQYLSVTSPNTVVMTNFQKNLIADQIYLNIGFDSIETRVNRHTEWLLVQENNPNQPLPEYLVRKMFDSLLGKDELGNIVPDPNLPERQRYGIEVRPRQSIFVDRTGALRNIFEYTNSILSTLRTRGFVDFSKLNSKEEIPNVILGEWDDVVESVEARALIVTIQFVQAEISCRVTNGRVTEVTIDKAGYGYKVAPKVTVLGAGKVPAQIETIIDANGAVVDTVIRNPGSGYVNAPALRVRPFTVIVEVDPDFNGKWSKYEWDGASWVRVHTQDYDTTLYWKYADWMDPSYNPQKILTATVGELFELDTLTLHDGDYVKVNNPGDGYYVILRKITSGSGSFNSEFDIIYSEAGTIQILDSIWDISIAQLGFDDQSTFDQLLYDQSNDTELSNILHAIREDIFIKENKVYQNKIFFKLIKYALTEQKFLDWAFKTAFINVRNIAGVLDQRSSYRYQDVTWYEDYLKEVKPYHTKIRNYQINYSIGADNNTQYEPASTYSTDFDLPAVYDTTTKSFITVDKDNELYGQYPYKSWVDNYGLQVGSITVSTHGAGYKVTPDVKIIPAPGDTGTGAKAVAYIGYGKIREIEVTDPGDGYKQQPTVLIVGGGDTELNTATAYANLVNYKVRSNKIAIKFDRISASTSTSIIGESSTFTDTFTATGSDFEYDLTWYSTTVERDITVTIDGILALNSDYYINNYTKYYTAPLASGSYHKKYSQLVLATPPARGSIVSITYKKNIEIYSAVERIRDYYNPVSGMPGKQLGQLMEGVEYPGVQVTGLPFEHSSAWDVLPFEQSSYADDIDFYVSIAITNPAAAGASSVIVSTTTNIAIGQYANIITTSTLANAFTATSVQVTAVNTASRVVTFSSALAHNVYPNPGSVVEFWSFAGVSSDVDTAIDGGDLSYTTALGLRPSDIILDGDGFLTPYTSHAPEEVVPGEIRESLSISVFTREPQGSPLIVNQKVLIDNTTDVHTANLTVRPASTSSVLVSLNGKYLKYGKGYNIDFANSVLTINTQTSTGIAGVTIVGVGGSEILGTKYLVSENTSTVSIPTRLSYGLIGSVYVTVNGETLESTSTGLGYSLSATTAKNPVAKLDIQGMTAETNVIQAWFFQSEYKGYSEVKEQIITANTSTTTYTLIQAPGVLGPYHGQAIVELNGLRLTPPGTTYYEVSDGQLEFEIRPNETHPSGAFSVSILEVYVNGVRLDPTKDWHLDKPNNSIYFGEGFLLTGDVLAITVISGYQYLIYGNKLVLNSPTSIGDVVKVITFTNHNSSNIRTEVFRANNGDQYRMSREVLNDSYVWVSIGGKPLLNKQDYRVLPDLVTVEIDRNYEYNLTDDVVITSFSDVLADKTVGYRMFKDIFGTVSFTRYSEVNTAFLTQELSVTDSEIVVDNGDALPIPVVAQRIPGVVFIQGERIEYYVKSGNTLTQLRRGTMGTSPKDVYAIGSAVVDQSRTQNIPVSDSVLVQSSTVTSNTYVINTATSAIGDGIVLTADVMSTNQIEVYLAGKLLAKSTATVHNAELAFDSGEYNSDNIVSAEYSIDTATQTVTLLCPFTTGTNITVIKRAGNVWYNPGTSLLESDTAQAQFLLERQAGLPDKYQYGKF